MIGAGVSDSNVQMLLLSLPNDLHIKSLRFPVVNLPTGTERTCTASSVSCGDQSRVETGPEMPLNTASQIRVTHIGEIQREIIFKFCFVKHLCHSSVDRVGK